MKVHEFVGLAALFFLLTLQATVTTKIVHAPKKLADFTKLVDPAPTEVKEATKNNKASQKDNNVSPAREYCPTCVKVDGVCYNRTYLFELTAPFGNPVIIRKMGILRSQNVLYYSFEPTLDDPEYSKVAYVSLDSRTSHTQYITGKQIFNFGTFDIRQRENEIYLGGSDGIWVVKNPNGKVSPVPSLYGGKGYTINNVIWKGYVYFSKENQPGIIIDGRKWNLNILMDTSIYNFVVDKAVDYNVVFINGTGLYAFYSTTGEEVKLSENRFFRGLTVDLDGVVYAWYIDGIYKVNFNNVFVHSKLTRVSDVEVDAMAFDQANNIIYSKEKSLYKLTNLFTYEC